MVPLVLGIAELGYFAGIGHPRSTTGQILAYFLGFLLAMVGVMIAGRRLGDNPRAAFRSVSGLILALFVTSVSVGLTSTILADHSPTRRRQ